MRSVFRALRRACLTMSVTGLLAGTAWAQQGQINGVVTDTSGGVLPAMLVGAFSGQFSGGDNGVFSIMVGNDGKVSGVGQSSNGSSFTVSGVANASGSIVMNGSGQAGASQFTGVIDPNSGSLVGTWRLKSKQGSFNGRKQ